MAMDKNVVFLEGQIGDDFKYGKTQDMKEFCTFTLSINSFIKDMADSTERTNSQVFIRTMIFDKRLVEYMHKVGAKQGQRVSVFARLTSHKSEYRGITYIQNNVVVRDIHVIKMKADKWNV